MNRSLRPWVFNSTFDFSDKLKKFSSKVRSRISCEKNGINWKNWKIFYFSVGGDDLYWNVSWRIKSIIIPFLWYSIGSKTKVSLARFAYSTYFHSNSTFKKTALDLISLYISWIHREYDSTTSHYICIAKTNEYKRKQIDVQKTDHYQR